MKKYVLFLLCFFVVSACNNAKIHKISTQSVIEQEKQTIEKNPLEYSQEAYIKNYTALQTPQNTEDFTVFLPVLMFHYIKDVAVNSRDQLGYRLSFFPSKLQEFLNFFKKNNIETLTFLDLKEIIEQKRTFPPKAVILTFDDGYIDQYQNAFSLLKKYNMKGVFFIIASKPDNDRNYANWEQIREMSDSGQEIGSHTVSHFNLTSLSLDKIKYEIEMSKKIIEEKIGKSVITFSYPLGKYNSRVLNLVKENYLFARTIKAGKYFSFLKRYEIPVVRMFPTSDIVSLKILFNINEI